MLLLCYDLRHLDLITTPSLHAFCKTTGHRVKVQEHLQILQLEGSHGRSEGSLFSENRETFMTPGQPCQKEFDPSRKEKKS